MREFIDISELEKLARTALEEEAPDAAELRDLLQIIEGELVPERGSERSMASAIAERLAALQEKLRTALGSRAQ